MSQNPERRPGPLLWIVPLVSLSTLAAILALPFVWDALDLDPRPIGWMRLVGIVMIFVTMGWLLIWFFGFTVVSRRTKWICFILLVTLSGGTAAAIDDVTWTANLVPSFHFRWQKDPQEKLAEYLASEQVDPSGLPPIDLTIDSIADFPRYRGLRVDGIIHPSDLFDLKWEDEKPREVWRRPCGGGFSGIAVAGNVAVTLEQREGNEVVVCYDRKTGGERWTYAYPAHFKDITGDGPRATPTIYDGEIYSFGALGDLVCLDGETGIKKWSVNVLNDCKAKVAGWGMTSSPLIVDDLVIVNAGIDPENNAGLALAAYRRQDGSRAWASGSFAAGYSSPQLVTLTGRRQILLFDAGGVAGFDPESGRELWRHPWSTYKDMNIIQPIVVEGNRVFVSSEVNNGSVLLQIARQSNDYTVSVVWESKAFAARQANPVLLGGYLYGMSNGSLVCLDLATGRRLWRGKSYGQGQLLAVSGTLLIQSERGDLVLVPADPKRFQEVARLAVFPDRRTWNTPALAGRRLFLRNDEEMVCLELPLRK